MTLLRTLAFAAAATLSPALAQNVTMWGGLGTELFIVPGVRLGLSAPVGQVSGLNMAVRGTAGVLVVPLVGDPAPGTQSGGVLPFPLVTGDFDLLLSRDRSGVGFYGGPSVGTVMGQAWLFGAVAGYTNTFGSGTWGYYVEGKLRGIVGPADLRGVSPGLHLGVTYRF
ncbi:MULTISPECIES: hypothetical protein [Deinococcus]|uniref:Outer membrane protein beta-barrel domain-containing protein n=1 Tax=Deinococcus rufus TaxID=2136097 RepID=A0ABV7ZEN8_9DEIO|nr:hypothetical protein [Deinococcus sp. AB2017081]WQE96889.1 hypothetical protein U2P90_08295 [Deinococcus sp. AB2017081]